MRNLFKDHIFNGSSITLQRIGMPGYFLCVCIVFVEVSELQA